MTTTPTDAGLTLARPADGLTSAKLYRFGGIIVAGLVLLAGVALVGSRNQSTGLHDVMAYEDARALMKEADMQHDAIRATVFGSALTSLGSDATSALRAELDESVTLFREAIDEASTYSIGADLRAEIDALGPLVDTYGKDSAALADSIADLTSTLDEQRAAAEALFTQWSTSFEDLKVALDATASHLDGQYTVWGKVISGMDVVAKIAVDDRIVGLGAVLVIGGLLVSTVLSLVFVPSFFTVMDDFGWLMQRIFGRFIGPSDEEDQPAADQGKDNAQSKQGQLPLAAE